MKQQFIIQEGHSRLLLLFAGWGGEANLFRHYRPAAADFLLISDYRSLDFAIEPLCGYEEIDVIGWSMGVWMAAYALSGLSLPIRKACALNGTPHPIDDQRGIPVEVFRGTLQGFSPLTLQKFRRRMCGDTAGVKAFLSHQPLRSLDDLQEELRIIYETVTSQPPRPFAWTEAWIGCRDLIFPVDNQREAWKQVPCVEADEPHYSELLFRRVLETSR